MKFVRACCIRHVVAGALLSTAVPVIAQSTAAANPPQRPNGEGMVDDYEGDTIVVNGTASYQSMRGAVQTDIPPERQLSPTDIRAYGVNSITELLTELAPQTRSDRGRGGEGPVTLLNGRRISGFAEIRDIPTEAIERVDILPEEVALKYGYSASQRVVNIVLRRRFRSITGELEGTTATRGGGHAGEVEAGLLRIRQGNRFNLNLEADMSEAITEADRNLISRSGSALNDSQFRTIRPEAKTLALNSVYATTILGDVGATINATFDYSDSDSLRGLDGTSGPLASSEPLRQSVESGTGHLGFTLNKDVSKWRNSLTGGYDHNESRTSTERYIVTRRTDRARSNTDTGNVQLVSAGPLFDLPAGPLSASIKLGVEASGFDAASVRLGAVRNSSLSRNTANGRLSIDLPITSTRNDVLAALGNLSANFNVAGDRISSFGTLGSYGYGANWTPRKGISLIASFTEDRSAPTVGQLSNPTVTTPDIRTFDYVRGTTVDISQVSGGNAALRADRRHVTKLGLTLKPFDKTDITFTANYIKSSIRDTIANFPEPTAAIEAAFPDRFTRDVSGNLTQVDARPINFERQERSELRWGFTFSKSIRSDNSKLMAAIRETPRFRKMQAAREKEQVARAALQTQGDGRPGGQPGGQNQSGQADGGQGASRDGRSPRGGDGAGGPGGFRGGGGPGGFGGFGGGRGGGQNGGRIQLGFFHTWHFKDEVLIRRGLPVLNLLNGDTIGSNGGTSEHELEAQLGYSNNGIGMRLTANWQSATTVIAGPSSPTGNLRFDDRTTANLRLFINLGQQASLVKYWWAQGTRVSLGVNNLFDSRQRVTDATGATPLRYQAGYLDPTGRTIRLSIRKLFF